MISFIDSHSHLGSLEHDPIEDILERARLAGIEKMISVSTDEGSWLTNETFAKTYDHVYYTLGIHPHDAIRWVECAYKLESLYHQSFNPKKCVAIGEIGLDFHYNYSPPDVQVDVFESQLQMAKTLNLPVVIHCRDAFDALYNSIKKVGLSPWGGVMHCFTGDTKRAHEALDLGLKISFSGILTFKTAEALREAAKSLPTDAILLETDCPYLAPIPNRGKPNEPSYLPLTAKVLGEIRNEPIEEVSRYTVENTSLLFQL